MAGKKEMKHYSAKYKAEVCPLCEALRCLNYETIEQVSEKLLERQSW